MAEVTPPGPRAQAYHAYLAEEGYRPKFDREGDVEFKAEGLYLCLFANEDDPTYLYLAAPNVWSFRDHASEERRRALDIAMHMQLLYKGLKIVVLSESVWISYQGFLPQESEFAGVLPRVIDLLLTGVREFHHSMWEDDGGEDEEQGGVQA